MLKMRFFGSSAVKGRGYVVCGGAAPPPGCDGRLRSAKISSHAAPRLHRQQSGNAD